jgi:hypothetical protein
VTVTRKEVESLILERPRKFTAEEVNYGPCAEGSAFRCCSCLRFYIRAIDSHAICEIMRSPKVDEEGVQPDFVCDWHTVDGDVYYYEPEEEPKVQMAEYESSDPT